MISATAGFAAAPGLRVPDVPGSFAAHQSIVACAAAAKSPDRRAGWTDTLARVNDEDDEGMPEPSACPSTHLADAAKEANVLGPFAPFPPEQGQVGATPVGPFVAPCHLQADRSKRILPGR